jgi:hypothetical protein
MFVLPFSNSIFFTSNTFSPYLLIKTPNTLIPLKFYEPPILLFRNFTGNSQTFFSSFSISSAFRILFKTVFNSLNFTYSYIHLKGIGFKLYKSSNSIVVSSGFNHYTKLTFPLCFKFVVRRAYLILYSSKTSHNYYVNLIRHIRFPDPYRAKGFRFKNQIIKLKVGKQR